MRHLTILEHGAHIGRTRERLTVRFHGDEREELHVPLRRLKSVVIAKEGVSLSAAAIMALAARGVKLFFLDFRGVPIACLSGTHQHAVVNVRKQQFLSVADDRACRYAQAFILGKIRNQRATLLYFSKYPALGDPAALRSAAAAILSLADHVRSTTFAQLDNWRNVLLGMEGDAARIYWRAAALHLGIRAFSQREGRAACDPANQLLNYAYGVLANHLWAAVIHAGLEPFAGFLHVDRPGKPSLVLDLMEEYRAWVADRLVFKLLRSPTPPDQLSTHAKRFIIDGINTTMDTLYPYRNKKLSLAAIIQRQVYLLAGAITGRQTHYKPYLFKW